MFEILLNRSTAILMEKFEFKFFGFMPITSVRIIWLLYGKKCLEQKFFINKGCSETRRRPSH